MAKFDLKFLDYYNRPTFIATKEDTITGDLISIKIFDGETDALNEIFLDKSTAIKFAKTLRTEINKIQ